MKEKLIAGLFILTLPLLTFASSDIPLWFRKSGFLGLTYQHDAAKELEKNLLARKIPETPETWTAQDRLAGLRQRFIDFENLHKAINTPEAKRFMDVVQRLESRQDFSWESIQTAYRRERLDLNEAEDQVFRNLISAWKNEMIAARAWGPLLGKPETLQKLFSSNDSSLWENFFRTRASQLDRIGSVMTRLALTDQLRFPDLPLELQASGSLGDQVWLRSVWDLDLRNPRSQASRPPAPTTSSGAIERELYQLEESLTVQIPLCGPSHESLAPDAWSRSSRANEVGSLRAAFRPSKIAADAALDRTRKALELLIKTQKSVRLWQSNPEALRLLLNEVSRDEFPRDKASWPSLISESRHRLPPQLANQALAVEDLVRLGELVREPISIHGFEDLEGQIDDFLQRIVRNISIPRATSALAAELELIRTSLAFEKARLETSRPSQGAAVHFLKNTLREIWQSYQNRAQLGLSPSLNLLTPASWDGLKTEADFIAQIRILRQTIESNTRDERARVKACELNAPGISFE